MTIKELIQKKLPNDLWSIASEFTMPENFLNEDIELIILILKSKSIDKKEEKQSRFNLLSIMNKEQVDRLRDILIREKNKLEEIEKKYEEKKIEIKQKYNDRFQSGSYKKTLGKIKEDEYKHREIEHEEAENLLS